MSVPTGFIHMSASTGLNSYARPCWGAEFICRGGPMCPPMLARWLNIDIGAIISIMKKSFRITLPYCFICLFVIASCDMPTISSNHAKQIDIQNWRYRDLIPGQSITVAYGDIANHTAKPITLVGASSPEVGEIEMHISSESQGMMTMREMEQILIEPGKTISFIEGGYHLMLFDPDIDQSKRAISIIFEFDDGQQVSVVASSFAL